MLPLSPHRNPSPRRRLATAAAFGLLALFAARGIRAEEPRPNALGSPLDAVSTKLADRRWLVAFLLEPAAFLPGTAMPKSDLSEQEAADMAAFFYSLRQAKADTEKVPAGDATSGERLFRQRGCVGCHSTKPGETGLGPNLAGAGVMLKPAWTVRWLRDPHAYHSMSPMPKLELSEAEIADLTAYLSTLRAGKERVETTGVEKHPGDAKRGRQLVGDYECFSCHSISGFRPPTAPVRLPSEQELAASPDVALEKGRALVMFYRCRGCHSLEGEGGVVASQLELATQAPPTLDREGARVQPSWLTEFLKKPRNLRPWLDMRMPNYQMGDAEARTLAAYLARLSGASLEDEPVVVAAPELIHGGQVRFDSYKCTQCHPASAAAAAAIPPEDRAIDLAQAHSRLRPSWIEGFLAKPRDFAGPATRMPVVFFEADGKPKVSHPQEDITALRAYLLAPQPLAPAAAKPTAAAVDWSKMEY